MKEFKQAIKKEKELAAKKYSYYSSLNEPVRSDIFGLIDSKCLANCYFSQYVAYDKLIDMINERDRREDYRLWY